MADSYATAAAGLTTPLVKGVAVSPSAADLPFVPRQIYAAGAGTLTVVWAKDDATGTHAIGAGERVAWRVKKITAATATGLEIFE